MKRRLCIAELAEFFQTVERAPIELLAAIEAVRLEARQIPVTMLPRISGRGGRRRIRRR
jgi:hypothetical protein